MTIVRKQNPISVYGKLQNEKYTTFLGIVENDDEFDELIEEYQEVFGHSIEFSAVRTTKQEYAKAKAEAFSVLFRSLYGPVVNVLVSTIQISRR